MLIVIAGKKKINSNIYMYIPFIYLLKDSTIDNSNAHGNISEEIRPNVIDGKNDIIVMRILETFQSLVRNLS